MPSEKEFGKRIESEARNTNQVTNDDLICRDCVNATIEMDRCEAFPIRKPNAIYYGGDCEEYETM